MTAGNAGDPAMDPGDAGPEATGPGILDPVTVRLARSGPDRGADRAGSRARIAAKWLPLTLVVILLPGRYGLGHYRFTGGTVYVVARVVLRIGRLDTIGPANPDRQVVPASTRQPEDEHGSRSPPQRSS